ncbi:arylamine N-acetyltransferase [Myxococcus sp. CA051A]|uniref:arylamine N-acetyltransferase family protein n=1 Tax=unclassified Myxococcus TaxID=2648731 RepID=UPI00157B2B7D|nr:MULTISPECIES: arylamine N-acetyltransferase [unclassified Myxococcus]NTX09170.1 arylamine N-acetyltransferase [Myxococcus sp. CA056]NTX39692.1 arylamine N-acetyltransferase [Myxococcus sp. CA033]NTX56299.1 arylamine N-acetyltransferase [Myxococcus sp. CA039A]NTX61411.1 arylamine N-acetyltransferase [Myxococcus sp. CA051A]
MFDAARYMERIQAPADASLATLHRAHLESVPFENLDIHLSRPIRLDTDALFDKVVTRRRGGFCYELNGLFSRLLTARGYSVTPLSARVASDARDGTFGPEFDHLTLQVEDGGEQWLVDVGFGEGFLEPLRLDERGVQTRAGRDYRLAADGAGLLLWRDSEQGWEAQYALSLVPRALEDFTGMCHHHQTSPESIFTQRRLCTKATPKGRVTLKEGALVITEGKERRELTVLDEDSRRRALAEYFGVVL